MTKKESNQANSRKKDSSPEGVGFFGKIMRAAADLFRGEPTKTAEQPQTDEVTQATKLLEIVRSQNKFGQSRSYLVEESRSNDFYTMQEALGSANDQERSTQHAERAYKRPTLDETKKLIERIEAKVEGMSLDEMHQFINRDIPQYLFDIATVVTPLEQIVAVYYVIEAIEGKRRKILRSLRTEAKNMASAEEPYDYNKDLITEEFLDNSRLEVARSLVYLVAFNEGLFGPNDLGYLPDTGMSLANKESKLLYITNEIVTILSREDDPNIFGVPTELLYQGTMDRLNKNRAYFIGRRVSDKDFPPFPKKVTTK